MDYGRLPVFSALQSEYPQINEQAVIDAVVQREAVSLFVERVPRHRILDNDTPLMHLVL